MKLGMEAFLMKISCREWGITPINIKIYLLNKKSQLF